MDMDMDMVYYIWVSLLPLGIVIVLVYLWNDCQNIMLAFEINQIIIATDIRMPLIVIAILLFFCKVIIIISFKIVIRFNYLVYNFFL